MRIISKLILILVSVFQPFGSSAQDVPAREPVPTLAVFPFSSPEDHDYGVFMADRLIAELMRYREVPAWQQRRFELVEPDTLIPAQKERMLNTRKKLEEADLEALRAAARADLAMLGAVTDTGIRTIHLRVIDLATGETRWRGSARDDIKWVWIYAKRPIGDIVMADIVSRMGYLEFDRQPPVLDAEELPQKVAWRAFQTHQNAIVGSYERLIREGIVRDNLFDIAETGLPMGPRIGADDRQRVWQSTGADAVLCGSLMVSGKNEAVNNAAIAIRLVEVPSGRILWAGNASGRKVWRKDRFDELTIAVSGELVAQMAQMREGVVASAVASLPEPDDGLGWAAQGKVYLESGLLEKAEEAFLKAETFAESQGQAYHGLGQIYARRPALRQRAIDYFNKALTFDSNKSEVYYHMAEVYRDMGTGQTIDFAQRAIAQDSTYGAPYKLLGDWYGAGDWYATQDEDVATIHYYARYLSLESTDIEVGVRLGKVLLRAEDYKTLEQLVVPFLDSHPEQSTDLLPIVAQWAAAKENVEQSSRYWDQYLKRVSERDYKTYTSAELLLPDEEVEGYRALAEDEKQVLDRDFWALQDPDPTTEVNERQLEHFRRVWLARQSFSLVTYPWDRRGEVYIRYGNPDYRSRSGRVPGVMPLAVERVKEQLYAELYEARTTGELVGTVFPIRSSRAMMADQFGLMGRNDADSHTQGDGFMPVSGGVDHSLVPWESWVYADLGGGIEITFTDELGTGNFNFAPLPPRQLPGMRSLSRLQEHAPEATFARAVQETPDQYEPWQDYRPLEFYYDLLDARGDSSLSRFDVAYGLPPESISRNARLELSMALTDSSQSQVYRLAKQVVAGEDLKAGTLFTDLLNLQIPSGSYRLTVKARDDNANRLGLFQQDVVVEPYGTDGLKMSDLVLAARIVESNVESPFRRGDLEVVPIPTRSFAVGQQLGLYYEIYNLTADSFGQMRYQVTVQVKSEAGETGLRRLLPGETLKPEVSLTYDQVGEQTAEQIQLFVDLAQARQGRNRLIVTVEDLNAGRVISKESVFRYGQ